MTASSPDNQTLALRRFSRRRLLGALGVASAGLVLAACGDDGGGDGAGVTVDPQNDDATAASTAAAAADAPLELEVEPIIWVEPREVLQGSVFLIVIDAPGAGFASVAFQGEVLSMQQEASRFFAILGLDALTPVGPIPLIISIANVAGTPVVRRETIIDVQDSAWQTEVVELDDDNRALLDPAVIREDNETRAAFLRGENIDRFWNDVFDLPAAGVITSGYGLLRSYNFRPPTEYHGGLDFAGDAGDTIIAPTGGIVRWGGQTQRRGNGLIIDHGGGLTSGYYHLSDFVVRPGQVVRPGEFIARMGATGLATGPHLHWEIVVHGVTVNPVQWIRASDFPSPAQDLDPLNALPTPIRFTG